MNREAGFAPATYRGAVMNELILAAAMICQAPGGLKRECLGEVIECARRSKSGVIGQRPRDFLVLKECLTGRREPVRKQGFI